MEEAGSFEEVGSDVTSCAGVVLGVAPVVTVVVAVVDAEFSWCRKSAGAATMLFCEEEAAAEADASPTAGGTCWGVGMGTMGTAREG